MSELSEETRNKIRKAMKDTPRLKPRPKPKEKNEPDNEPEKKSDAFKVRYDKLRELINGSRSIGHLKRLMGELDDMEKTAGETRH